MVKNVLFLISLGLCLPLHAMEDVRPARQEPEAGCPCLRKVSCTSVLCGGALALGLLSLAYKDHQECAHMPDPCVFDPSFNEVRYEFDADDSTVRTRVWHKYGFYNDDVDPLLCHPQ